jgi:sugar/nucleoside kinase (ribokinase family)
VPGGPSLYSARTAAALGASVTLITCELESPGGAPFDRAALSGIEVVELPRLKGKPMPRYANEYDAAGVRTQYLVEQGDVLPIGVVQTNDPPRFLAPVDVLIYAPAFHELVSPPAAAIPARHTAVSLQGLLRDVDRNLRVIHHRAPVDQVIEWAAFADFLFLSEEDTANAPLLARQLARAGVATFLTRGFEGALFLDDDGEHQFPAIPTTALDPTGAGDCFATAFMVRYAETGDGEQAVRFALAAGSLAVERPGLAGVATRSQIEARVQQVPA